MYEFGVYVEKRMQELKQQIAAFKVEIEKRKYELELIQKILQEYSHGRV